MNSETGIRKNIIGEPFGLPIFGASVLTGFSEKHSKIKDYSAARRNILPQNPSHAFGFHEVNPPASFRVPLILLLLGFPLFIILS